MNDVLRNDESGSDERSKSAGGTVVSLHVEPAGDVPMTALASAHLVPGRGMVGDRYYLRRGRDAAYDQLTCDVTLIEQETIEAMNQGSHRLTREQVRGAISSCGIAPSRNWCGVLSASAM